MGCLSSYSEEEQSQIMTTLTFIQEKGWRHDTNDPYQFQIIVGEKLMSQTKTIKSFQSSLESVQEENLQKEKYMKDLKADLDHQKDVNEDMEQEINKKDDVIKALQYGINGKIKMIDDLVQIRKVNEEDNEIMEKKLSVQNKVLIELKNKLKEKVDIQNQQEELQRLVDEIKHLKDINEEKEFELQNISEEYTNLKIKLKSIETIEIGNEEVLTLKDELDASRNFKCKECDKEFVSQENLTKHKKAIHLNHHRLQLQLRLKDVARKISEQKLHLVNKISELRETEFSESLTCRCQGWCAINHTKHSWKVTKSESVSKIVQRMGLRLVV